MHQPEAPTESLGQYLRSHREKAGLSLGGLAALCGYSRSYLSKIETGSHTPGVQTVAHIAATIGAHVARRAS
ncbi:MAG: helix-turn-helix domain-containing protein [Nocardioidaceae bacterium]